MTNKNHSQTLVGSRHAIHNLTYPNAANRIAGTNEGKSIVVDATNLWQVAKQDDDDSYWFLSGVAPLTWVQIATAVTADLDFGYNAFAGPGTVNIDAGSLTWAPAGAYDFIVDLSSSDDPLGGEGGTYYGLYVNNGTDNFQVVRAAANQVDVRGSINDIVVGCSGKIELDVAEKFDIELTSDVASGNFVNLESSGSAGLSGASGVQSWLDMFVRIEQSGTAEYNALRINLTEASTGSGDTNLLNLIVGGSTQFLVASDGNTQIGTGTPGVATGAGDLFVTDTLETGGNTSIIGRLSIGTNTVDTGTGLYIYEASANSRVRVETANVAGYAIHSFKTPSYNVEYNLNDSTGEFQFYSQTGGRIHNGQARSR
jgi:hypothetical protein